MNEQSLKRILKSKENTMSGLGDAPIPEIIDNISLLKRIVEAVKGFFTGLYEFPLHLFPKRGAETFDMRSSFNLTPPSTTVTLIDWTVPKGAIGFWRAYSLFSNVPAGTNAYWNMQVNGTEVFKYHGNPTNDMIKDLALGNDLSSEIDAMQELKEGDRVIVQGTITAAVISTISARIKGWIVTDPTMRRMRTGG